MGLYTPKRPRKEKRLSDDQKRQLLSFHNKGLSNIEVGKIMSLDPKRVTSNVNRMGIQLGKIKSI